LFAVGVHLANSSSFKDDSFMKIVLFKSFRGVTVLELLVVLVIAALLSGMAIPSFVEMVNRNRLTTITNEFVAALSFARSEAIKRGQFVVVRKTGSYWDSGWQVFVDSDRSIASRKNVFNSDSDLELRIYPAIQDGYSLRGNHNFVNFVAYRADGSSNNIGSFVICNNENIVGAKLIIINSTGRARIAPDSDHDGTPEKDDGSEIASCTDDF